MPPAFFLFVGWVWLAVTLMSHINRILSGNTYTYAKKNAEGKIASAFDRLLR